jgi:hypothetical protein
VLRVSTCNNGKGQQLGDASATTAVEAAASVQVGMTANFMQPALITAALPTAVASPQGSNAHRGRRLRPRFVSERHGRGGTVRLRSRFVAPMRGRGQGAFPLSSRLWEASPRRHSAFALSSCL